MRRHAGVRVAGLVVKASLQNMLARLRRQVRMQNELARVHTELLLGRKLQGIVGTRREVDRGDVETRALRPPPAGPGSATSPEVRAN